MYGYSIHVEIRNKANRMLSSEQRIFLSYHVYDGNGNVLAYDNVRSELGKNIFSHSTERVELKVDALEPGEYILGIDVVEEGVTWFSEHEEMEKKLRIAVK